MDATRAAASALGAVVERAVESLFLEWVSVAQARRVGQILRDLVGFCEVGLGVTELADVSPRVASAFVHAPGTDGSQPSNAGLHLRRSAIRLLFRAARREGAVEGDPTLDLVLPPRSQLSTRPLSDEEVSLCRSASVWSLADRRRSAAWALAEATCRTAEMAQVCRDDLDLDERRVWIRGGRTAEDRWGSLSDWGVEQVAQRLAVLPASGNSLLVYRGAQGRDVGQISACIAVRDVLVRAGLGSEAGVRPGSVPAWAGRQILAETGRIDEVARRLGIRSLDRAARFIGWDWGEGDTG